jgi:hypothetical protein
MSVGNAGIMLKQARREHATPNELGFETESLTGFIEDLEAHSQRAKSAGAAIVEGLRETENLAHRENSRMIG